MQKETYLGDYFPYDFRKNVCILTHLKYRSKVNAGKWSRLWFKLYSISLFTDWQEFCWFSDYFTGVHCHDDSISLRLDFLPSSSFHLLASTLPLSLSLQATHCFPHNYICVLCLEPPYWGLNGGLDWPEDEGHQNTSCGLVTLRCLLGRWRSVHPWFRNLNLVYCLNFMQFSVEI